MKTININRFISAPEAAEAEPITLGELDPNLPDLPLHAWMQMGYEAWPEVVKVVLDDHGTARQAWDFLMAKPAEELAQMIAGIAALQESSRMLLELLSCVAGNKVIEQQELSEAINGIRS